MFMIIPFVFIWESLIAFSSARLNNKHDRLTPCRSPVRAVNERVGRAMKRWLEDFECGQTAPCLRRP